MAGNKRLYLYWDPELDDGFRQRLEHALRDLKVDAADASGVDPDPEAPAVNVALVSARGGMVLPPHIDVLVLAGPGDFPAVGNAFRLETDDIADGSKRWMRFVDQLRIKLERTSLALTGDDLAVRLDEETRRADAAQRARDVLERERNEALRTASRLEADLVSSHSRVEKLEQQLGQLSAIHQLSAFAITSVEPQYREAVSAARDAAWRAQLAAQRAAEIAAKYPDVFVWGKTATYSGESENQHPNRFGVMTFLGAHQEHTASYRGEFQNGQRSGYGVGVSSDGLTWAGQWKNDEACGFGLLETPDGRRFEGEVAPDSDGAPKQVRGWTWQPADPSPRKSATHHVVTPALPPPQAAGG